jgi:hypothetical protein
LGGIREKRLLAIGTNNRQRIKSADGFFNNHLLAAFIRWQIGLSNPFNFPIQSR